MKELTIEEKARRYDEAKYIMKEYLESGNAGVIAENTIKNAFPELSESEDEIVIVALKSGINGLLKKEYHLKGIGGISFDRIIDWLEKQAQKPADIYCQEHCKGYQETGRCFADGGCQAKRDNDKKLQQKTKETMYDKPAWSGENENIIEWLIGYLEYQIMNATITEEKDNCLDAISMLKSLKERVQSQPKQEWSEKDEKMLKEIISDVKFEGYNNDLQANSYKKINWLKSLRPQSQWKPSDEQMGVIEAVINNRSFQRRHLDSLYEQLKKLREE